MDDSDDVFQIFANDDNGSSAGLIETLHMCKHWVEEHDMTIAEALGIMFDMIRPGNSENSHDVKGIFMGAMYAYGYGYLVEDFPSIYINVMPWGVGFTIATERNFRYANLSDREREAISKSLCVILRSGGMDATVEGSLIHLRSPDGGEMQDVDIDEVVSRFIREVDDELGESTPEPRKPRPRDPDDPTDKWRP